MKPVPLSPPVPAAPKPSHRAGDDLCEVKVTHLGRVQRVRRQRKPDVAVHLLAETFRTLGDPSRLRIVHALALQELCVCDIAVAVGMSQSAVSHSLRALRQLRLVRHRRDGKTTYYRLDDAHIGRLLADGFEHVEEQL